MKHKQKERERERVRERPGFQAGRVKASSERKVNGMARLFDRYGRTCLTIYYVVYFVLYIYTVSSND